MSEMRFFVLQSRITRILKEENIHAMCWVKIALPYYYIILSCVYVYIQIYIYIFVYIHTHMIK